MLKMVWILMALTLIACGSSTSSETTDRQVALVTAGDEFNLWWDLDFAFLDCDDFFFDEVDPTLVTYPFTPGNPGYCTNAPSLSGDYMQWNDGCDLDSPFAGWSIYRSGNVRLVDSAFSTVEFTVEEPSTSAFICYMRYVVQVEKL